MNRFILSALTMLTTGLLVGCGPSHTTPAHVNPARAYGYRPAPSATPSNSSSSSGTASRATVSQPTRFGKLPQRSESAGHVESVQGFPPGHPLHQDNSYTDQPHHQMDEGNIPHHDMNNELPHSNFDF